MTDLMKSGYHSFLKAVDSSVFVGVIKGVTASRLCGRCIHGKWAPKPPHRQYCGGNKPDHLRLAIA
jgi:hypothetical protein